MPNIEPITRQEKILAGEDIKPITRMEYFLKEAASGGGGGGGTPSADTSDAWKTMTVKPTYERKAVVPEQTVVLYNGVGTVTGCDFGGLSDGDTAYFHVNFAGSDFYGVYYYTTIIDGEMGFSEYPTWQSGYAYIKADGTVYQPMVSAYPTVSGSCYVEAYVAKFVEASWEAGVRIFDFSAYAPLVKDVPSTGGGTVPFDSSINTLAFKDTSDNTYTPSSRQFIFADEAFKYRAPMIAYSDYSWRLVGDVYESVAVSATLPGYYSVAEPTPFYEIDIPSGSGSAYVYYVFPRDTNLEYIPGGDVAQ